MASETTADLAEVHRIFQVADEFYRSYREALLNLERNREEPKPAEWIPISDH